jgi:tetratricopeptide (TPR) repeat protein
LAVQYWLNQQPETLRLAEASAQMALSLDGHDAWSHFAMGFVAMQQRRFDLAGMHFERAVNLNPNNVLAASDRADWLTRTGRPDEALQILDAAMRRDPFPAMWLWDMRFTALFNLKRYDDAIAALRNMTEFNFMHHAYFAAAYAHAGRQEDARREVAAFLAAKPGATSALVAAAGPYAQPDLLEHLLDGLQRRGCRNDRQEPRHWPSELTLRYLQASTIGTTGAALMAKLAPIGAIISTVAALLRNGVTAICRDKVRASAPIGGKAWVPTASQPAISLLPPVVLRASLTGMSAPSSTMIGHSMLS